ncbi:MAG: 2-succinyl-5-enolpyruvyl-6-hydroxy-3-cyclohexene-1-carboxylic-acid synthase [Candidatus Limnocylindrales bacterium]|nr:2-succinyl-5-enolpyruvyl-6-hydroxy-3-cyclohexene-1-carboxylic-acid synthase [Candidatus Limnocylindrales bacterium]
MTDVRTLRELVEGLVEAGVAEVVVCPGSRSTPLALTARAHPGLRVRVLLDERSAGFFALGLARASRRPVAVIVTSGTAVANLFPAVVEASLARVPLVLLTADRPAELRERGAPQTIDQVRIFGGYVRWFSELPLLDGAPETRRHVRSVVGRAVATARGGPAGPVHLNIPFREPLVPTSALGPLDPPRAGDRHARPFTDVVAGRPGLAAGDLVALAALVASVERGLIVAGPQDDPDLPAAIARLAAATGYPIVADPLSGVRCGPHDRALVVAHADHLIRPGPWRDAHLPELVIRFGATPTSKPVVTLLGEVAPAQIVVDGDGGWSEPAIIPTTFIHADATATAISLADEIATVRAAADGPPETPWATSWSQADQLADRALLDWLGEVTDRGEPFEGLPFALLGGLLPDGALLWAGNSMPVRDLDAWLPSGARSIRPLSNRGANGIDGVVSTALGAAAADVGAVTLVVGDVSFLHDLNALVAARLHGLSATIVLIENDGGGIFSFLSQATTDAPEVGLPDHYEELFGTPHGIDVGPIVAALGGVYRSVSPSELREALADPFTPPGVRVFGFRTDRGRNVELHHEAAAVVADALSRL